MGWGEYEMGGLAKAFGVLLILVGIGSALYEYSMGNKLTAVALFVIFLVLGVVIASWGGYSRKQNTPIGRVEDSQDK
jgi:hypothetical protein